MANNPLTVSDVWLHTAGDDPQVAVEFSDDTVIYLAVDHYNALAQRFRDAITAALPRRPKEIFKE